MKNSSKENSRYEIRIAGYGGQGVVLAAVILAEAALMDGWHVAQSQSYGSQTRGGSSVSEIVLSNNKIDYPRTLKLDMLVALTQNAYDWNIPDMKEDGIVIVDSDLVHGVFWGKFVRLPFQQIARRIIEERAINVAVLGAIACVYPLISSDSIIKVISERLPSAKVTANLSVFYEAMTITKDLSTSFPTIEAQEEFEI